MESLRKTARVLDVVARIAFWVTMVGERCCSFSGR